MDRAERRVAIFRNDSPELYEIGTDNWHAGRDRFEHLVRARQAVVERRRLDRHRSHVRTGYPRRDIDGSDRRKEMNAIRRRGGGSQVLNPWT